MYKLHTLSSENVGKIDSILNGDLLMSEIICPHCDKAFKVDETGYTSIVAQVRDTEFEKSLTERVNQMEKENTN